MKNIFTVIMLFVLLAGCAKDNSVLSRDGYMLDTYILVKLYGGGSRQALDGVMQLCADYEAMFSRTMETSPVYLLNHAEGRPVDMPTEVVSVIQKAIHYSVLSEGKYDITVAPATDLWDFDAEAPSLPDADVLAEAVTHIGYRNIRIDVNTVTLDNGAQIDLGSIAKGYIADRMGDYLRTQGVTSALISLGGNVLVVGEKPSGQAFTVGVQKPFGAANEILGTIDARDMSLVTSGVYQRFFRLAGLLYHHILDTKTGMPRDSGLLSVSVLTEKSVDADALSTVLFTLGADEGLKLVNSLQGVEALFIESDGELRFSSGFGSTVTYVPEP